MQRYIDDVLSGRRTAGKLERAAVARHVRDLKTGKKRGLYFDEEIATRCCRFFGLMKGTDGEWKGKPFDLKPIQRFTVWCLTGWRRVKDGMRRFTRAYISMARGNGKTFFMALLVILFWAFDTPEEPRAEAYSCATSKTQARKVYDDVVAQIEENPPLRQLIKVWATRMTTPRSGGVFMPLSGTGKSADGMRPHLVTFDELHAFREEHRELWNKLTTAMGKRRQPLLAIITTAGDDESDLWEEQYDLAVSVVDPDIDFELDDWFVYIFEIDEGDDPFDEANWPKSNPLLNDKVIKIDELRSLAKIAKWNPVEKNNFLRYRCNTKVTSLAKLITSDLWARGRGPLPDLEGLSCHGGYDGGWKDDLAALSLVFPLEGRKYAILSQCFVPAQGKRNLASEPWATWIKEGYLTVTAGSSTDLQAVYDQVDEWREHYGIRTWAMDPNNCREFGSRIVSQGFDAFWFGQNHGKYNEPTRELVAALREGRILHGENPLLGWAMQNVIASTDSRGYIKPEKKRSKEKIDPACSTLMALSECLFAATDAPSYYEDGEFESG